MTAPLIVDLSRSVAGAFCARLLAFRGTQVLAFGGMSPRWGNVGPDGIDWLSEYLRAGIELIEDDLDKVNDAIRRADVVISGWDGGESTHDIDVRALNASAGEVVVSSFGSTGPYSGFLGGPIVDWASGGYLYITGYPDREPLHGPPTLPAYVSGYAAACAVEIVLSGQKEGIRGQRVDVSTMDVLSSAHQTTLSNFAAFGQIKKRQRLAQPIHPIGIIESADGWVSLVVVTEGQYDALAVLVGDDRLLTDPRFGDGRSRHEHADEFDAIISTWFSSQTSDDIVQTLQSLHVPAVKLVDPVSVLSDPQLAHRRYWMEWTNGSMRGWMPGEPIRFGQAGQRPVAAAEDTKVDRIGLPLKGKVVIDLTQVWAGPMATRILADLGATVVRVERPTATIDAGASFVHWKMHRGKYSLGIDIRSDDGRTILNDLIGVADVLVENSRPGVMERLGFGYDQAKAINSKLVYISLSGFGQDGPSAPWASFGPLLEAASSIQARTRYSDSPPLLLGHSLPDAVGGLAAAFAALHQLRVLDLEGAAHIDVSQLETYTAVAGEDILQASACGLPTMEADDPQRVFRCRGEDAWVVIESDWSEEAVAVIAQALGCDSSWEAIVSSLTERDRFDVTYRLQAVGVPTFPALDASDLAADEHLRARSQMVEVNIDGTVAWMPSLPLHGQPEIDRISPQAPVPGQDTVSVLRELLGYSEERIAELVHSGSVAQAYPAASAADGIPLRHLRERES